MSGVELAEILHSQYPGIGVIYMSGYLDDALAGKSPLRSAVFLQKPFAPQELLRTVREILDDAER
jgi:DNA-binding NtrC family response regulator